MENRLTYNIESVLKLFMPGMIDLLSEQQISWSSINKVSKAHMQKIRKEIESTGKMVEREVTFHSVIFGKLTRDNGRADAMFDYFNQLFYSLKKNLKEEERKFLHGMISNVLLKVNKEYLNFIGELAVLDHYMSMNLYELCNIEETVVSESNVSIDILFKSKVDSHELLIEVVNIHLANKEFTSFLDLRKHLELKLTEKVQSKILTKKRNIKIQPVLWIKDHSNLEFINEFYLKTNFGVENVLDPMVYCSYKLNEGRFEHRFESIKTITRP
ncbi:MAG: hypothetical protein JNJ40_12560 [Bacteroidia bacterium]|nr:hypothetical protein [Bacteroidia bacterium]